MPTITIPKELWDLCSPEKIYGEPPEGSKNIEMLCEEYNLSEKTMRGNVNKLISKGLWEIFTVKEGRRRTKYYRPIVKEKK